MVFSHEWFKDPLWTGGTDEGPLAAKEKGGGRNTLKQHAAAEIGALYFLLAKNGQTRALSQFNLNSLSISCMVHSHIQPPSSYAYSSKMEA